MARTNRKRKVWQKRLATKFCETMTTAPSSIILCGVGRAQEIPVFRKLLPDTKLIGVDPRKTMYCDLLDVFVQAALVAERKGRLIRFYERAFHFDSSSLFPHRWSDRNLPRKVLTTTLDRVLRKYVGDGPVALWMDCEGAELLALRGGIRCLIRTQAVVCEVSVRRVRRGAAHKAAVVEYLADAGFEVAWERPGRYNSEMMWVRA